MTRSRLLLVIACSLPAIATAQTGTRDPLIPRELAEALISSSGMMGRRPQIVVGSLPTTLANKVKLPAGTKTLGGMMVDQAAIGVIVVEGALNSVADPFHRELVAQGWEAPVENPMDFMRSEFVDPPSTDRRITANGRPEMYCGKAGTLNVQYEPDGFSRTVITLTSHATNQCAIMRDDMFRSRMGMIEMPKRPHLVNHPSARNSPGACQDYNHGMGDRKTSLGSQLAPSEILSHYAKQLADSGWKQTGTAVAAIFQKTDTTGMLREYQIVVHGPATGPGCRSVRTDLNGTSR